tara:strand:- start:472 stop:1572 length:1101 start_codon:yes stop_codon:yes gene_type:complete
MKKNFINYDNVNILEFITILLNKKKEIILIIFLSLLIGGSYNYIKRNSFESSIVIQPTSNSELIKFIPINYFLNSSINMLNTTEILDFNKLNTTTIINSNQLNASTILNRYLNELMDLNEISNIIENKEKIRRNISQLSKNDIKRIQSSIELDIKIADDLIDDKGNLRKNIKFEKNIPNYVVTFTWHNPEEIEDILLDILKITLTNLEKSIFNDLQEILKIVKDLNIKIDSERVKYLLEQSLIAKELNLVDSQIKSFDITDTSMLFTANTKDAAYYRGYKAIDKEIDLIQSRKYEYYADIQKNINKLQQSDLNLISYEAVSIKTNRKHDFKFTYLVSFFVGLIIGIFYAYFPYAFQSQNINRKKKT